MQLQVDTPEFEQYSSTCTVYRLATPNFLIPISNHLWKHPLRTSTPAILLNKLVVLFEIQIGLFALKKDEFKVFGRNNARETTPHFKLGNFLGIKRHYPFIHIEVDCKNTTRTTCRSVSVHPCKQNDKECTVMENGNRTKKCIL